MFNEEFEYDSFEYLILPGKVVFKLVDSHLKQRKQTLVQKLLS